MKGDLFDSFNGVPLNGVEFVFNEFFEFGEDIQKEVKERGVPLEYIDLLAFESNSRGI